MASRRMASISGCCFASSAEDLATNTYDDLAAEIVDGRLVTVESTADLPLRGRVPVVPEPQQDAVEARDLALAEPEAVAHLVLVAGRDRLGVPQLRPDAVDLVLGDVDAAEAFAAI